MKLAPTKFSGVISALPTPFLDQKVDYESLEKLVHYQIENGINGFVVNGTTAESPTLAWPEVEKIFVTVKKASGGKVPIVLGTGSNSTAHTIETNLKAEAMGADATLVVVPYYNKPPQRGLELHFKAVADSAKLPIILYNVPGRTITSMNIDTIKTLSTYKNIIGIKEAMGDVEFDRQIKNSVASDFLLLSGDDPTYLSFLKLGGHGIISVMSNALTFACASWTKLASENKWAEAEADLNKYKKLISLVYVEANPIPIKWMLFKMGLFKSAEMRLPLVSLEGQHFDSILVEMKKLGLL